MPFHVTYWSWFILAVILVIVEMTAPGIVFLWLGIAAAVTGLILLAFPGLGWEQQLLIFAGLSVVSVALGRLVYKRRLGDSDHPTLNRRGMQYVGRSFTLDVPIVNGFGKLRVDDTTWKVSGEDMPAGTTVEVTGVDGTVLKIERR